MIKIDEKKVIVGLIGLIIVVLLVVGLSTGMLNSNGNDVNKTNDTNKSNNTNDTEFNNSTKTDDVKSNEISASLEKDGLKLKLIGPKTVKAGNYIPLRFVITNVGNKTIEDFSLSSQSIGHDINEIKPGETVTYKTKIYEPTQKDLETDFDVPINKSKTEWDSTPGDCTISWKVGEKKYTVQFKGIVIKIYEK